MRINTNIASITAQEAATNTNKSVTSSLSKLSTGLRINKASDDASGLAIADKLRTQATSIDQGVTNGNSAITLLQIADKSMSEQSNILNTVKAKLIQANTDTTSTDGRESIRKDIKKLLTQLDNIAQQTNYNGNILLQASRASTEQSAGLSFQVGEKDGDLIVNTAIQSNTQGLAGREEALVPGTNDKIKAGDAQLIKNAGTTPITIKNASTTEAISISVSGKIGKLSTTVATDTLKISNASSADVDKLVQLAKDKPADLVNNNDGTFTLIAGKTIDFEKFNINSMTITSSNATAGDINMIGAANDRISVQNIGAEEATISGAGVATIGTTLSSLKNLGTEAFTTELADIYQNVIDKSITKLNSYRGDIGSTQNQVESAVRNLMTQSTNVKAAESIIRDVDYAAESANFNKQNIIAQAGTYAISQANASAQNVLRLLQ